MAATSQPLATQIALDILKKLDEQFSRLESVAEDSPRPYHLVILSDHGQSGGQTFLQRYGYSLEDLVKQHVQNYIVEAILTTNESMRCANKRMGMINRISFFIVISPILLF